jgi:hypothetical protein
MSWQIDWTDAFENGAYIDGAEDYPDRWAAQAAAFRAELEGQGRLRADLAYGEGPRERFDLCAPAGASVGLVVFVHGGYWLRFDKWTWSHLAAGCVARGWHVALPSYPLAPEARIPAITRAVARAVTAAAGEVAGPVRLAGHSAGGHLVSRMMCAGVLPEEVAGRLAAVVSISGLHQLGPLMSTAMNDRLRLTEAEAEAESPAAQAPLPGVPLIAWVGAQERPEFLRQTRLIEEVWGRKGASVSAVYEAGHDHFTVIEALALPDSPLTGAVLSGRPG